MLQRIYPSEKELFCLGPQELLNCSYDVIITAKMATSQGFFQLWEQVKVEGDQVCRIRGVGNEIISTRLSLDMVHLVRFCSGVKRRGTHLAETFDNFSSLVRILSALSKDTPSLSAI